jgi:glycosyltransferase involved in cell wall biosynthesis
MTNVIVTLTTIPNRLHDLGEQGIKLCIESLLNQSYQDYEIHFNIPYENQLTNQKYDPLPDWILQEERIKIFREADVGPITKILGTINRITNPETIIIVVDDDLVYHHDLVMEQVLNQDRFPEYIVGYDGMRSRDKDGKFSNYFGDTRDYYFTSHRRNSLVDILQHYKSVSYKRRYFEEDFFDFIKENSYWADDLLLAAYFSYKKRNRLCTYYHSDKELLTFDEWITEGGVCTFPVLRHTHHETFEGCNIFRQNPNNEETFLYRFIDNGYNL